MNRIYYKKFGSTEKGEKNRLDMDHKSAKKPY